MLNLIRRISGSIIPRQDRPWREDGRKRRLSSIDQDVDEQTSAKKAKGSSEDRGLDDREPVREESPLQAKETEDVKAVTKGVKEVELEDDKPPISEESSSPSPTTPPPETETQLPQESREGENSSDGEDSSLQSTLDPEDNSDSTHVEKEPSVFTDEGAANLENKSEVFAVDKEEEEAAATDEVSSVPTKLARGDEIPKESASDHSVKAVEETSTDVREAEAS